MNRHRPRSPWRWTAVLIVPLALAPAATRAQIGGAYNLSWNVIDSGGGTVAGGVLSMNGAIAQPITGSASGGVYALLGGFAPPAHAGQSDAEDPDVLDAAAGSIHASPNPTSGVCTIICDFAQVRRIAVGIYDPSGRLVRSLESSLTPGRHTFSWDGRDASGVPAGSGIYFLRVSTDKGNHSEKLVILKGVQ